MLDIIFLLDCGGCVGGEFEEVLCFVVEVWWCDWFGYYLLLFGCFVDMCEVGLDCLLVGFVYVWW